MTAPRNSAENSSQRLVAALWFSTGIFVVAMIVALVLAFTPAGSASGISLIPRTSLCLGASCRAGCPSLVRGMFGGVSLGAAECADPYTHRALAVGVVVAVAIGPLGLSLMWSLCWCLRRAGRVTDALTSRPPVTTTPPPVRTTPQPDT